MAPGRLRRLRKSEQVRNLIAETRLSAADFIMPYFVIEGKNKKEPIKSMPGVYRLSIDNLIKDIKEIEDLRIKGVLLFGICKKKDAQGAESYSKAGIIQKAIREIKGETRDVVVVTDVCLCGYTSHGHCGIVGKKKPVTSNQRPEFEIDNDETLKVLAKIAVSHAEAGADFVAPSAMMDHQVKTIREALDAGGYSDTGILAYSAKYASSFYGPFREALDSSPKFGDRKSYQMDYRNSDEALREIACDIEEGADIVMVKPALAYLDIIYRAKQNFNVPIAAFNVSGEYALIKAYCQKPETRNQKPEKNLVVEVLTAIKRAGADMIISYHAKEVGKWLK